VTTQHPPRHIVARAARHRVTLCGAPVGRWDLRVGDLRAARQAKLSVCPRCSAELPAWLGKTASSAATPAA
jgi:hypothetical protein